MSRGSLCKEMDEMCGTYAVGQAINYLAIDLSREKPDVYTYDSARDSITEAMSFWLESEFKKSKYWEGKKKDE
jgi:hypothetical protein